MAPANNSRVLILAAAAFGALFCLQPAGAEQPNAVMPKVASMEKCVFGQAHDRNSLPLRLHDLELATYGHEKSGSVATRVNSLHKIIGTKTTALLPPIAPQLDTGASTAAVAQQKIARPQFQASSQNAPSAKDSRVNAMLEDGMRKHEDGNEQEAARIFKNVLKQEPFNANASYNLGAIAEKDGDLSAALGHYRTALLGNPNDVQVQNAVAQVEDEIARRQSAAFTNPLKAPDNSHVLRASASEFTSRASTGYGAPLSGMSAASFPVRPKQVGVTQNYAPVVPITQTPRQPMKPVYKAAIRAALGSALLLGGSHMGGSLHCPMCRLLQRF